jgi:hypothetical protein
LRKSYDDCNGAVTLQNLVFAERDAGKVQF